MMIPIADWLACCRATAESPIRIWRVSADCSLPPAACHERVRRLRDRQIIKGYVAIIEPQALGCGMLFFVEVVLDRTTNDAFRAFAEHVSDIPEILECHMVAGGFDYLLKARVSDMAE